MTVRLLPVRYGAPALDALVDAVAEAKDGRPLRPVSVVVPSNYAGVAARRALAGRTGIAAVSFVTLYRLAELMAGPALAAQGRVPLSSPVLTAALRGALADEGGLFRAVATQPATVEALRRVHRELRDLDEQELDAVAATDARAAAVVAIDRQVSEQLRSRWFDETDLTLAARDCARDGTVAPGPVIVHLPQRLTASGAALLRELGRVAPLTVVLGLTGEPAADRGAARVLRRLGVSATPAAGASERSAMIERVVAADPDDEVRTAIRRVVAAIAGGTALERVVISFPPGAPYGRILTEQLAAAGLPWNGVGGATLAERVAGRALLGVLDLDRASLPRRDVLAMLASLPPRPDRPVAAWDRHSRRAGVVGGPSQWQNRLTRYAAGLRVAVDRGAPTEPGETGGGPDDRLAVTDDVDALRDFVAELAGRLQPPGRSTWSEHARRTRRLLDLVVGSEHSRLRWATDEQRAADRVESIVERLARLDTVTDLPVDSMVFRAAIDAELRSDLTTVGRLGEGIFVGPLPATIGLDPDVAIVLGMVEGGLPGVGADDPLLADSSRRAAAGALVTAQDRRDALLHQVLALASAARQAFVACRPRADLRTGAARYRSRWLDLVENCGAPGPVHEQTSFQAGLLGRLPAGSEQEALTGDLQRLCASGYPVEAHPAAAADPVLRHGLRMVRGRESDQLTEFDGNLSALASSGVALLVGDVFSPTALEAWTACPFAYFVRHVLGIREEEYPEDVLSIRPTDRGSLIHRVLEDVLDEALAAGTVPRPGKPWPEELRRRMVGSFDERSRDAVARGHVGRALHWRFEQRRLRRLLDVFERFDLDERAEYGVTPYAVELAFGRRGAVAIELPSGRVLHLVGKVDRVDTSGQRVVVIDYKTAGAPSPWNPDPFAGPIRLQLPIYGLAARRAAGLPGAEVMAEYWYLHRDPTRCRRRAVAVDEATQRRLPEVLQAITDGINGGLFVLHPDPPDPWRPWITCPACDPDGAGTATVWSRWLRKRAGVEVQDYLALVEPDPCAEQREPLAPAGAHLSVAP